MKILWCILIIGLFSCSQNDHYGLGEFDAINTSDAIEYMFNKHALQAKKEGVSARLNYLSYALESFYILPNHKTEIGSDSLKKLYGAWDKQNKIVDYKLQDVQIYPVNKTVANYHYQISIIYKDSSNAQKQLLQIESGTVIKIKDKWLFLNYQTGG